MEPFDEPSEPGAIRFADRRSHPLRVVATRLAVAVGLVLLIAAVVYLDRDDYSDVAGGEIGLIDAVYYATVAATTTGYGDIVPATPSARLLTIFVVTPLRVAFLVLVVSTTVEVLTASSRYLIRVQRWRKTLRNHYVICGYGTKGRSAAASLLSKGIEPGQIVIVETLAEPVEEANDDGFVVVMGDCTREMVLNRAGVALARGVIIAVHDDATAVLATLTVRLLNTEARVVVAVREEENSRILRRGGASLVITSDAATGRLLGLAVDSPHQAETIEDLLLVGQGLDLVERSVTDADVGQAVPPGTIYVIRHGRMRPAEGTIEAGDRLLTIENVPPPKPT